MEKMNVIYRRLDEIAAYDNNPRKNDAAVNAVAASIREFGFKVPIIIDAAGTIIAGHTRFKAAQALGMEEVPCLIADELSSEQVQAYRIIDNKTQEMSDWDFSKLDEELGQIMDIDMRQFGFGDDELADKFAGIQHLDEGEEIDLDDFEDENFDCVCPVCGFRFNEVAE